MRAGLDRCGQPDAALSRRGSARRRRRRHAAADVPRSLPQSDHVAVLPRDEQVSLPVRVRERCEGPLVRAHARDGRHGHYAEGGDGGLGRAELLRLSGLLALGGGTARSIENSLAELLSSALGDVPLRVDEFTGGWVTFDPSQRISLGRANSAIGDSFVLGTRALHPADRARVIIGPMSPAQAEEFSPGGPQFPRVKQLVSALCRDPIQP